MWSDGEFRLFISHVWGDMNCGIVGDDVWCYNHPDGEFRETNINGIGSDNPVSGASGCACPLL